MALGTFRPGVYTATLGGVALGLTTGDGFRLRYRRKSIPINNTGAYGDTLIDGIYRGIEGVQVITTLKEIVAGAQTAMWPNGASGFDGTLGTSTKGIGTLDSANALALVLTPAAGTPAAANGPSNGVFTASLAILAAENDVEFLFGPVETDVPIVFNLILYDASGTKRFFLWS
jgi:hypothetical protein